MPRFIASEITGYESGGHVLSTTASVLDTAYGGRQVARFASHGALHGVTCRQRAQRRAAEMNAEHDAWMRENGYAAA